MAYNPPAFKNAITLPLSANESTCPIEDLPACLADQAATVNRYPDHLPLQNAIANWVGVDADRIVVTAGGDDAIERMMRTSICPDRPTVVCHTPSFVMFGIYAKNYDGSLSETVWQSGDFPVDAFCDSIDDQTALVVLVTPNNPTGGTIDLATIERVADAARQRGLMLLVDNAYIEFADEDFTPRLAQIDNIAIVRTFSKAWGLAGLRTGFLIAPNAEYASQIRDAAGPYPVSALSLETARRALDENMPAMQRQVKRICQLRTALESLLDECRATTVPSGGNFLLANFESAKLDADAVWSSLGDRGIGVRKFPGSELLKNQLRITVPASATEYFMLANALCESFGLDVEAAKTSLLSLDTMEAEPVPSNDLSKASMPPESQTGDRTATSNRTTKETAIDIKLNLDGTGQTEVATGIGFLDHMLTALAFHSGMDLKLVCDGDLHIDDHHTAEDCALALGTAIDDALGKRTGIARFGYAYAPLDEALARTVVDLSGRPWPEIHLGLTREMVGTWASENITHFFQSLAMTLRCSLHVDVIRGGNDHHRAEAAFKSLAKALKQALARTDGAVPSTKGVL